MDIPPNVDQEIWMKIMNETNANNLERFNAYIIGKLRRLTFITRLMQRYHQIYSPLYGYDASLLQINYDNCMSQSMSKGSELRYYALFCMRRICELSDQE